MINASQELQKIIERYFVIYSSDIIAPLIADLASLEHELLVRQIGEPGAKPTYEQIQKLANDIYVLRVTERSINVRRRHIERLALDGPGDWLM